MKPDEVALLLAIADYPNAYVREVVAAIRMNQKRAVYILDKWTEKGWYEYGVSVLAGWLTMTGKQEAAKARAAT